MPATYPFPTASRVHPAYLPRLHVAGRTARVLLPATVAVLSVGYAANYYGEVLHQRRIAAAIEAERRAAETRRRNAMLQDAYGDRGSLEELERAMAVYESSEQV